MSLQVHQQHLNLLEYGISHSISITNIFNPGLNLDVMEFGFSDDDWDTESEEIYDPEY